MKLIIVRHGETEENKQGILQSHMPGTLSPEGIEQGEKLAERLKAEKIDVIFSSDLRRAVDTTELIAQYHSRIPVEYTRELREGDGGSFTGKPTKDLDWNNRPSDAETLEQMQARAKKLIDEICKKYNDKTVLFVGHAGFNRVLIAQIIGAKNPFKDVSDQLNTSVNIFEIFEDKTHKIHCLNCTKHLEE